jgi:3-hydroxyisobutyrate dehydrogenase-like beta-hydroxyacid dehydrogenase
MHSLRVACVGLGRMGSGMARSIQRAGFPLVVYNRTLEKTKPFVESGAASARSPREAASRADILITNLMDDASVLGVMTGQDGILAGMRPGTIHISTTTISPSLTTRLAALHAEHGSHLLAAPVAGRPDAAAAGKLYSFVAGDTQIIERCRPVINAYSVKLILLGTDPASASSMKLVGNFFGASLLELVGQSFVFAERRGVLGPFSEMLKSFLPPFAEYLDRIETRNFNNPGFTLDAGLKDVTLMLEAAAEVQVPLPYASLIRDKCLAAQAHGMNQLDWSCFTEISRLNAGQE